MPLGAASANQEGITQRQPGNATEGRFCPRKRHSSQKAAGTFPPRNVLGLPAPLPAVTPPVRHVTYCPTGDPDPVWLRRAGCQSRPTSARDGVEYCYGYHCLVEPLPLYFPAGRIPNALAVLVSALQVPSNCAIPSPQPVGEAAHPGGRAVPLHELRFGLLQISLDFASPVISGSAHVPPPPPRPEVGQPTQAGAEGPVRSASEGTDGAPSELAIRETEIGRAHV